MNFSEYVAILSEIQTCWIKQTGKTDCRIGKRKTGIQPFKV